MRALVTGSAGFIGSHVVRALLDEGIEVRAFVLPGEEARNLRGLDVERVRGDVTSRADLRGAMRGCDWVFHLAAIYALWLPSPSRFRAVNVEGTRNVLELARDARELGVQRVVHTSSIARFGGQGPGRRATEESPFALGPTGDRYAASKAEAHEVAVSLARELDVTIVAPAGPIGPGDVGPTPTGRLLLAALSLPVVTVTRTVTNFAHVRDMARAHVAAARVGGRGETYLLGNEDLSLAELARRALAIVGLERPVVEVPYALAEVAGRLGDVYGAVARKAPPITSAAVAISRLGLAADASRAVRELRMPQTSIDVALREALEWFAREGYVKSRALRARLRRVWA